MNNKEKATQVINEHDFEPECIASYLDDAGLLAPDLPKPDEETDDVTIWLHRGPAVTSTNDGWVWISSYQLDSRTARSVARSLLAAADHADNQRNAE